jgi:predicted GTPase
MLTLGQLLYDLNDSYTHFDVYEQEDIHDTEDFKEIRDIVSVLPSKKKILSNASQDEIVEFSKNHLLDEVLLAYNDLAHSQGNRISIVLKKT